MSNPNYGVWRPMAENIEFNALESNSNAVMTVADTVRTTLGPKGLDKLLIDQAMNRHISNDGVTILLSLRAIHPVARMIVEIAERQEQLVGDGTTTAVVMASEMIKEGKRLIKELGVHPTKVVEGIENGVKHACKILEKDAKKISLEDKELEQIIKTSLSSKLDGITLSELVIKSIRTVGNNSLYNNLFDFDKSIKVIRKINVSDAVFNGIVLERKRMDQEMPLRILKPKIMIVKLDLKPVKESWLKENNRYEEILNMENDRLLKSKRIVDEIIGIADSIYEDEDTGLIYIENGSGKNIVTIIVSGTTKETSLERWRSVIDGVNASEAALNRGIVAGGGAAEIHVIEKLKSLRLKGLEQVGLDVVASALESIMRQILTNAGFNGLEKVMAAKASKPNIGIDIDSGELVNMFEKGILDPLLVKLMALEAAGEISKSVLRIDRNLAAEDLSQQSVSEIKR